MLLGVVLIDDNSQWEGEEYDLNLKFLLWKSETTRQTAWVIVYLPSHCTYSRAYR